MLFVKKKAGAKEAPSAKPTGLFIDPDARPEDDAGQVIDVPAVEVSPVEEVSAVGEVTAEVKATPRMGGFSSLRVKKAAGVDKPAEAQARSEKSTKPGMLSSLKVRFAAKTPEKGAQAQSKPDDDVQPTAATAAEPKKAKAAKAKKPAASRPAKFGGKAEKQVVLLTELDNGRQLYWSLEADKLSQTSETPQGTVYSFSKEDFRFRAADTLNYRQANDLALQEVGEAVQVVNRSKDLSAVYATRQERALDSKFLLAPAQQALDRLLIERKKGGQSLICGFHLKDSADESSVAVLFHVSADGETSKPQISVNPDSMEFVIAQFSASRKVDKNTTEVVLFDNAEFLTALAGAAAFPNEPVWRGVPVRQVLSMAAMGAMAVSVALGGWAGYQFQQVSSLQAKQARLQRDLADTKKQMSALILGSVPDFAKAMSLDVPALMARAQQIWIPDTRLTMVADLVSVKYDLWMPVARTTTFNNRPTAVDPITFAHQQKLVNYTPPEGCTRTPVGATGALNETQLTVACETGNPALAHYRND